MEDAIAFFQKANHGQITNCLILIVCVCVFCDILRSGRRIGDIVSVAMVSG